MEYIKKFNKILSFSSENNIFYKNYKYKNFDNTILTYYYSKIWNKLELFIPNIIHPNIITLCGLISLSMSYIYSNYQYGNYQYGNYYMAIGTILYFTFDGIDGIHARRTKQTSIIGEYLDHIIDLINLGMIGDAILNQFNINSIVIKNLLISSLSLNFMLSHIEAVETKCIIFENLSDASLLTTIIIILFLFNIKFPEYILNENTIIMVVIFLIIYCNYKIIKLPMNYNVEYIKYISIIHYALKFITLYIYPTYNFWQITTIDTLLLMYIINLKIFNIRVNSLLSLIPLLYIYNNNLTTILIIIVNILIILQLSQELDINLFLNKKRVYCCGVFDLCHVGHMILFENIVKSFNEPIELIVGIHNDEECRGYKREPILNENIRYETVKHCKYVDKIIKDASLIVSNELINEYKISCVIIGEEYRGNNDYKWYGNAMDLGIHKYIPRCDLISTSDIINRIKKNY